MQNPRDHYTFSKSFILTGFSGKEMDTFNSAKLPFSIGTKHKVTREPSWGRN